MILVTLFLMKIKTYRYLCHRLRFERCQSQAGGGRVFNLPGLHSAIIKVKPLKSTWRKKMADKAKLVQIKLLQQEIRDRQLKEKQDRAERRKEQEKRRLENERKGEVVQVIRKSEKVRRTKKKQLRYIQKRDVN
ncbi:hypothetical protein DICVIV_13814 [Dictyocaulus viviparus]|uniref:Coiled-coil domain-containing protein 86 n=3 Tax=Dictyocaulus viviparus TaxID=29172 RepID=A0A0D8X6T4_DICVI|nr:hypothetical protein DICVIV_13814 [Dictyocaulus viviparus]